MRAVLNSFAKPLQTLRTLVRTLPVVWRVEPRGTTLLAFVLVGQGLLPALTLFLTKWTVDQIVALASGTGTVPLVTLSLLWFGLLLLDPLLNAFNQLLQADVAEKFTAHINRSLMRKTESFKGLDVLEDPAFYNDLSLLQEGASRRPMNLVVLLALTVRDCLSVLLLSLALVTLAWWAPLALLLATLPHTVATLRLRDLGFQALLANTPEGRAMAYDSRVAMSHAFAQEVRLFNLFGWLRRRYDQRFAKVHDSMRRVRRQEVTRILPASFLSMVVSAGLFAWAVGQASRGLVSVGQVVIVIQALSQVQFATRDIVTYLGMMYERALFFRTYFTFLDLEPRIRQPENAKPLDRKSTHDVTFEHVTFRYPDGRLALEDVSFQVAAGETVAIVGENGAGKTTLVNLLLRFYDPSQGRILVNGTDLRELDLDAWRASVGAVFQSFNRYDYTIRENLALGNLEQIENTERLQRTLDRAGASFALDATGCGLDTQLGKEFGGTELSGGQWQKLALARVLLREAAVLVLDEPTAALDPRSEAALDLLRK